MRFLNINPLLSEIERKESEIDIFKYILNMVDEEDFKSFQKNEEIYYFFPFTSNRMSHFPSNDCD